LDLFSARGVVCLLGELACHGCPMDVRFVCALCVLLVGALWAFGDKVAMSTLSKSAPVAPDEA